MIAPRSISPAMSYKARLHASGTTTASLLGNKAGMGNPRRPVSRRERNVASRSRSYAVTAKATTPHCDWPISSRIVQSIDA